MLSKREMAMEKWREWEGRLSCPCCQEGLTVGEDGLDCPRKHHYDFSAKGSAQLLYGNLRPAFYDRTLFEGRGRMLEAGLFDALVTAVSAELKKAAAAYWLDAGCGEAVLTHRIWEKAAGVCLAMDLSKDAIQMAGTRYGGQMALAVGDVRRPPLLPGALDAILNLFTPADYAAFGRVLKPGGWLLKAVPAQEHLGELRLKPGSREETLDRIVAGFERHCRDVDVQRIHTVFPVPEALVPALSVMSPVTAHDAAEVLDRLKAQGQVRVTVDCLLLAGRMRNHAHGG